MHVLREWGRRWAGLPEWRSFLNKPAFTHEVEECLVALEALLSWLDAAASGSPPLSNLTVVDVCCGKGTFSMLLAYLCARPAAVSPQLKQVTRILMVDKMSSDSKVNWHHIAAANADTAVNVPVEAIGSCNIHDASFAARLRALVSHSIVVNFSLLFYFHFFRPSILQ